MGQGVTFRIGRILIQTQLGSRPSFGTQHGYEAAYDFQAESVSNAVINIGLVRLPPLQRPKVDRGAAK